MTQPTIHVVRSSASDAQYVICDDCTMVASQCESLWRHGIRSTKWLHENGTGHKVRYYKIDAISPVESV